MKDAAGEGRGRPAFVAGYVADALDLVAHHPRVHLDTTVVGIPFDWGDTKLPADCPARLAVR